MEVQPRARAPLVHHHLLIRPLTNTHRKRRHICKDNVTALATESHCRQHGYFNGLTLFLMKSSPLWDTSSPFRISPWNQTWKAGSSWGVPFPTKSYRCNGAANWPDRQELFNNELQIPDSLFSDCLAQMHRGGHTQPEVSKHSIWQLAVLSPGNQIKSN